MRDDGSPVAALVLDLVEWVADTPRPYAEVMSAWRTSCPRLTVWEDAVAEGFVTCAATDGALLVEATAAGRAALAGAGRATASA